MKRITKETKAIADAHLQAIKTGQFDDPIIHTKDGLIEALRAGKTSSDLLHQIELRFVSMTSNLYSSVFEYQSGAYKKAVYKGFKILLQN